MIEGIFEGSLLGHLDCSFIKYFLMNCLNMSGVAHDHKVLVRLDYKSRII